MQRNATIMNNTTLRRIAIITAVLTVLLALDGIYMLVVNYHPDDTGNNGFGGFHPSDGTTVLIAAALLLIFTVVAFIASTRTRRTVVTAPAEPEITEASTRNTEAVNPEVKS